MKTTPPQVVLRDVDDRDLDVLFEHAGEHWGRGIATLALQEFLRRFEPARPLHGRAASDNAASIRVLEKSGFTRVGDGRAFAHGREEETGEVILRLDA